MIEKVGLVIPDSAVALIDAGELVRTNGVLRNAETMEIFKHLDIVPLDAESSWQELGRAISRVVKENKKAVVITVAVVAVAATTTGVILYKKHKKRKDLEEKCNAWLNGAIKNYIEAAQNGELDVDTITACEEALMSLPHITDKVFVSMTKEQILEFSVGIKEYTAKLAEVHNYSIEDPGMLESNGNVVTFLLNNLQIQKDILQKCA